MAINRNMPNLDQLQLSLFDELQPEESKAKPHPITKLVTELENTAKSSTGQGFDIKKDQTGRIDEVIIDIKNKDCMLIAAILNPVDDYYFFVIKEFGLLNKDADYPSKFVRGTKQIFNQQLNLSGLKREDYQFLHFVVALKYGVSMSLWEKGVSGHFSKDTIS